MTQRFLAKYCPICGQPAGRPYHPFCSSRCADIDLNRWLSDVYRVPATEPEDGEPAETEATGPSEA